MSHIPPSAQSSGYRTIAVRYTGLGDSATDLTIAIGVTMFDTTYAVTCSSAGGLSGDGHQASGLGYVDLPIVDRTTTTFRAILPLGGLAAGDVLEFVVQGNAA
jgi:hypothetical protein